ncbi:hypothetical protein IQ249_08350 [Lusitaniella coriacea LEGE 07157]|uniref:ATP-grasp domain-containing protein n=1 Tax=Lusitaniella coriacea LEGE 07157 TaxID=945747 RepID=A0A8J7DYA7_9CYAN|nr:hypothetical protein [Lusitaniella coriacea]MBE9115901.1 hypothetical protein [Lusitaniella coriacea LEGE 07157]
MNSIGILNAKPGNWAFEKLAQNLSEVLNIPIREIPLDKNYVLYYPETEIKSIKDKSFIPIDAIILASDKRKQAELFNKYNIPIPKTVLLNSKREVETLLLQENQCQWCLKYPTSCGASGHRILGTIDDIPDRFPKPYIVQEFIEMRNPEVYRLYCVAGDIFGWNVRKFARDRGKGQKSPWVAHARGACYAFPTPSIAPPLELARTVLAHAQLIDSFGCIDLIKRENGEWLVLEIGTDGIFNHVDRNLGLPQLEKQIEKKIVNAFKLYAKSASK